MLADILKNELPNGRFWTHAWSIIDGCTPISPGCQNCWLAGIATRFKWEGLVTDGHFDGRVVQRPDRVLSGVPGGRPKVFAVWSDFFHEKVTDTFRNVAFNEIARHPEHYFLIITKRPEVAVKWCQGFGALKNVLIMVTMENQEMAWKRVPAAAQLAAMGWTMGALIEPMLGPVVFDRFIPGKGAPKLLFQWVICGQENGKGKRAFDPSWAMDVRDQCAQAGIPFLYKADGGHLGGPFSPVCHGVPDL